MSTIGGVDPMEQLREATRALVRDKFGGQRAAAAEIGISQGYLSEFLSGKRHGGRAIVQRLAPWLPKETAAVMGMPAPGGTLAELENLATALRLTAGNLHPSTVAYAHALRGHWIVDRSVADWTQMLVDFETDNVPALQKAEAEKAASATPARSTVRRRKGTAQQKKAK